MTGTLPTPQNQIKDRIWNSDPGDKYPTKRASVQCRTFLNRHPTLRKKVVLMAHHSTSIYWRNQPSYFLIIPGKPHADKTQPFKNYATTRIFLTSASSSACAVEVCRSANVVSGEYWVENASERQVRLLLSLVAMTLVLNVTT